MSKKHEKALRALIKSGLTFGEAVNVFAESRTESDLAYVKLAQEYGRDGELEVDDSAQVSDSDEGAYVMAWVWVESPDNEEDAEEEEEA